MIGNNSIKKSGFSMIMSQSFSKVILFYLLFLGYSIAIAQRIIAPGNEYKEGEQVVAPSFGIRLTIPPGWTGYLPQDIELFTFSNDTAKDLSVVMYATRNENLENIRKSWKEGKDLAPGIVVTPQESLIANDTMSYGRLEMTNDKNLTAYGLAACGSYGACYTLLLRSQSGIKDQYINVLPDFFKSISFFDPTTLGPYDLFDWKEYLNGKYLAMYDSKPGSQETNEIWLCPNGTFKAKIKRKGLFKEEIGKYKGKQSGTFEVSGIGTTGELILRFRKLDEIRVDLEIKENNLIFLNENRFFVAENLRCKS